MTTPKLDQKKKKQKQKKQEQEKKKESGPKETKIKKHNNNKKKTGRDRGFRFKNPDLNFAKETHPMWIPTTTKIRRGVQLIQCVVLQNKHDWAGCVPHWDDPDQDQ